MRIVSFFLFLSLSIIGSAPHEQFHTLYKEFQDKASYYNAAALHEWINKEHNGVLHKYSIHYVKQYPSNMRGTLLYVSLPSEIRYKVLTHSIFNDDGTAFEIFESLPYATALEHLINYDYSSTLSKKIKPYERFLLKEDQISAILAVRNGNFIWDDKDGYKTLPAMTLAALMRYPLQKKHTHFGQDVTDTLKKIKPYVFNKLQLDGKRIADNTHDSIESDIIFGESLHKSMHHYPVIMLKHAIDVGSLGYNLWNNKNITGIATSLVLDRVAMYIASPLLSESSKDDAYHYYQARLTMEMFIYASTYMMGQSFDFPSVIPYLLLTTAYWYYVRTNERFPRTFVLGQPEKQKNWCTIL